MILYLVLSTICMGVLLLFYHAVLEEEKMHHINRGYLLLSLIFSLTIPVIPVGLADSMLPWSHHLQASEIHPFLFGKGSTVSAAEVNDDAISQRPGEETSSFGSPIRFVLIIYFAVAAVLFVRLLRIVTLIRMKTRRNPGRIFGGYNVVLLTKQVVPHTFMNTIFVNRKQYERGEIGKEVLVHELTHVKQKHTLDILFAELLKILFWFNPILYFYKKAILLNHEFLADEAVISAGAGVPEYQTLLLKMVMAQPANKLTSNFNYKMTKKRFEMMTRTTSNPRTFLKTTALLPLFSILSVLLGCESSSFDYTAPDGEITIEVGDSEMIKMNGEEIHTSELGEYLDQLPQGSETEFCLNIQSNAPMGLVWEVQEAIAWHNHSKGSPNRIKFVNIEVLDAETIRLEGEEVSLRELNKGLAGLNAGQDLTIYFGISHKAPPDLIRNIEEVIRASGVSRISYHSDRRPQ